jgi:hypothetical protein
MARSRSCVKALRLSLPLSMLLAAACSGGGGEAGPPDASDGLPACSLGSTMAEIEEKLFRSTKCSVCHMLTPSGQFPLYPTRLDLGSPGLAERVVDKPTESDPTKGKCAGRILVPKNDPLNGVFVEKVERPSCGDPMPQALPALKPDEVSCVKRWAILAARSVP